MESQPTDKQIVKAKPNLSLAKLDGFNSLADVEATASVLIKSGLLPDALDTWQKVALVVMRGREIGFGAITSVENIFVINNRTTISVHGINAKIKELGIAHRTIRDYEMVQKENPNKPGDMVTDFVTEIEFIRYYPLIKEVVRERSIFSFNDAKRADLTDKKPWKQYPKQQVWNRCFVFGARRVAADALLGMMETSEWADKENIDYNINAEGFIEPKIVG